MNELNLQDLDDIPEGVYDRRVLRGLHSFREENDSVGRVGLYSSSELERLEALCGTQRDVERRMPVKVTSYYADIARESEAVRAIVKAQPRETADLSGAPDPGGQLDYSPVEGVLHKYEMLLLYLVSTCSSHCRFCYRQELISHRPIRRSSGFALPKGLAKLAEVTSYVRHHNAEVQAGRGIHPLSGRPAIREALLSGGDPMVLPNRVLASWLTGLAQCGVDVVRIGTKELAFFPFRFDDSFFQMLDWVHARCPSLRLIFMLHFDHPDEVTSHVV
jgi:lysine 2,3-aminomutase